MAISSTRNFNLDIGDLMEDASAIAGFDATTGYDIRIAKRSLNLLQLEWSNLGINLWQVEEKLWSDVATGLITTLTKGVGDYEVAEDTISILDVSLRTDHGTSDQVDYSLSRISQPTYAAITSKKQEGRPLQYMFDRKEIKNYSSGSTTTRGSVFKLWPIPDETEKYSLIYWRIKRMADAGDALSVTLEVPDRFLPALVHGLAFNMAKRSDIGNIRTGAPVIFNEYARLLDMALDEDRVKTSLVLSPRAHRSV
jgi:hypothetical protein